jgi:hypothetical protein
MYDVKSLLADSGYINDTSITGGRVGVYQFGHQTLWSNMKVHCLERQSKAMYFNGPLKSTDNVQKSRTIDDHLQYVLAV